MSPPVTAGPGSASPTQPLLPADTIGTEKADIRPRTTLQQLQQLLPTCQRCRRLRRKCDTQLPHCQPCQRAGVDCLLFDHALKQALPRAYVQSLLTRVEHLEAVKASGGRTATTGEPPQTTTRVHATSSVTPPSRVADATTPSSATTLVTALAHIQASPAVSVSVSHTDNCDHHGRHPPPDQETYDVVVPSATPSGKSRYWGSSSVFALTVEILHHATARGFMTIDDIDSPGPHGSGDAHAETEAGAEMNTNDSTTGPFSTATEADIRSLLRLYLVSSNTLYGFVDADQIQSDLEVYLAVRRQRQSQSGPLPPSPSAALGDQAHPYFRITMMCAIACATRARYRPQRTADSLAYYASAVPFVEEVTAAVSPASLQALLLLILFCLFFPRKGDVWKLLDYACRLALELGYHTETDADIEVPGETEGQGGAGTEAWAGRVSANNTGSADISDPDPRTENGAQKKLRRSTFWGLYAIERIVGQLFGRGSDLPESIITVAYPSALLSTAATSPGIDRTALQEMSIAHHYRLVYLRSEIFRTLYLPARPVDGPAAAATRAPGEALTWLREQYRTLHAWRDELTLPEGDQREGVATLTCDVGYDATMCFLFQPLLLRALRGHAGDADDEDDDDTSCSVVASDPFYSSLRLIRTYEKIVRAPETSVLGSYPMTFMSAHYIYLASSTLLAYALLRLDGRTRTLKRMSQDDHGDAETSATAESENSTEELDWGVYVDVSSSCLILLSWCGERWPGMLGMLGVYQRLFARTIRELIGRGILR